MTAIAISPHSLWPITNRAIEEDYSQSTRTQSAFKISSRANISRPISIANQFLKIQQECLVEGWDGYGANPIDDKILGNVIRFVNLLDRAIPIPELSPEPDGEIAIEWYGTNKSTISISIGVGDTINYAAIFPDQHKANGTESLTNENKTVIEHYIRKVVGIE